jgi:hypothetical protein
MMDIYLHASKDDISGFDGYLDTLTYTSTKMAD